MELILVLAMVVPAKALPWILIAYVAYKGLQMQPRVARVRATPKY
ncbi:hypothetical protein [Ferrimonas marina]|uniref:Uncharacterized protein n=1 Tax=Ferrimonas marina TaxID=299255 RepID=A0A1M5QYK9_9GAMM|nr:hypothetical protein [Ferrimonas marina]SHH19182.1 hypothetical protein SAMN02745129_1414 [Ferrimonas marina]